MHARNFKLHPCLPRRRLAVVVGVLLSASTQPTIAATTWPVTSCLDTGAGTLRAVVGAATTLSGDIVDLSGLTCPQSRISLTTGDIVVPQDSLTIKGTGQFGLALDASENFIGQNPRVLTHTGGGTLTLRDLSVQGGFVYHDGIDSVGGCVYSAAKIEVRDSRLSVCEVYSFTQNARGGAVYAKDTLKIYGSLIKYSTAQARGNGYGGGVAAGGGITIRDSVVTGNKVLVAGAEKSANGGGAFSKVGIDVKYSSVASNAVSGQYGAGALGGGLRSPGNVNVKYATIDSNTATAGEGGLGAGINVNGDVQVVNSTISNNHASGNYGGIDAFSSDGPASFLMRNSTVSGNHADAQVGGVYVDAAATKIYNSTIAFNTATYGTSGHAPPAFNSPGLVVSAAAGPVALTLDSTLLSNNTYGAGSENDLSFNRESAAYKITFTPASAHNLVRSTFVTLPADTLQGTCPSLGPLRDNGGLTRTHALLGGSVAIDAGENLQNLFAYDQRGPATANGTQDYFRASDSPDAPSPVPDIGAYERQQADLLFDAGFDGCVNLP